jgi:CRAL/TRIO domain/CRAL/TRIO, N-terminal domain
LTTTNNNSAVAREEENDSGKRDGYCAKMGCLASKEEDVDIITTTAAQEQKKAPTTRNNNEGGTTTGNNNGSSVDILLNEQELHPLPYRDGEEELVFFDALQSFSDAIGNMSYAPTATMIPGGRGAASVASPQTMLLLSRTTTTKEEEEENQIMALSETMDEINQQQQEEGDESKEKPPTTKQQLHHHHHHGFRQSVVEIKQKLVVMKKGNVAIHGYPGQLGPQELEACLQFRDELKRRELEDEEPAYREMVHAYSPAEDEAFALCRFLRAREFNVDAVFAMLDDNGAVEIWNRAKEQNFYREDLGRQFYHGCPLPVLMRLFPVVISGLAKNGATMFYFQPGGMDMNALECVANLPELVPNLWYMLHDGGISSMQREVQAHGGHDKTVLSERIIVFDMKNISSSLFNTEFMKEAAKITACFPETMNRTYMINVPTAFTVVWAVAKLFLEARTINKIGFFAWESRAKQDLLNFVDSKELLSDYGGTGPSFEDVLKERQAEAGSCARWIVECLATAVRNSHYFTFDLSDNESVASVQVFSKGDHGAEVTITKNSDGTVVVPSTPIKRKDDNVQGSHYSVSLDSSQLQGPGSFQVQADGTVKEYYLVAIGVQKTSG